jgi:hypothetical protein
MGTNNVREFAKEEKENSRKTTYSLERSKRGERTGGEDETESENTEQSDDAKLTELWRVEQTWALVGKEERRKGKRTEKRPSCHDASDAIRKTAKPKRERKESVGRTESVLFEGQLRFARRKRKTRTRK